MSNSTTTLYLQGLAVTNGVNAFTTTNWLGTPGTVLCLRHVAQDYPGFLGGYKMLEEAVSPVLGEVITTSTNVTSAGVGGGPQTNIITYVQATVTLKTAPLYAVQNGDRCYMESPAGGVAVGAATVTQNGPNLYSGQTGLPLLVSLPSTAAGSFTISGSYQ